MKLKTLSLIVPSLVVGALLTHCGPSDVGEMLLDGGEHLLDGGEMLLDGGEMPDAMANPDALPMATEMPIACDVESTQTYTYATGIIYTYTYYFATATIGESSERPKFWTELCVAPSPPAQCPAGVICTGAAYPFYENGYCSLNYGSGLFSDGKLWITCGVEYTTTEPGQPTQITVPYVPPISVRLWVE